MLGVLSYIVTYSLSCIALKFLISILFSFFIQLI